MNSFSRVLLSFRHALNGLLRVVRYERNFQKHILASAFVIIAALLFGFSRLEWVALLLVIGMVMTLEILNSLVEDLADILRPRIHDQVKTVKDGAAAAVLFAAFIAVVVGFFLFIPHVQELLA